MVRPTEAASPWLWALRLRARWLVPLVFLTLLVLVKDWPPASCGAGK
jgi:hypothetical protein